MLNVDLALKPFDPLPHVEQEVASLVLQLLVEVVEIAFDLAGHAGTGYSAEEMHVRVYR